MTNARGGPRGLAQDERNARINSIARAMKKAASSSVSGTVSDQDMSRALNVFKGMIRPSMASKTIAKASKPKGRAMAKGGKAKK